LARAVGMTESELKRLESAAETFIRWWANAGEHAAGSCCRE
jgi:hypothetical protein